MREARQAQAAGDAAALQYARQLDAELTLAMPVMRQVYSEAWWQQASPEQIGAAWQVTASWAGVGEPYAQAVLQQLREQTRARYGVDVDDVRVQARDVVALLARVRAGRATPGPDRQPETLGTVSYVIRDIRSNTIVAQQLGRVPGAGAGMYAEAADMLIGHASRIDELAGTPGALASLVVEIHAGSDVTGEPMVRLAGDQAHAVRDAAEQRRQRILTGELAAHPAELREVLLAEARRLSDLIEGHNAAAVSEPIPLVARYHLDEAAKASEQLDYVRLRIAAAEADLRGENGALVFEQAALRGRCDDEWWQTATPAEVAVLWGYVAGWEPGWAKLTMTSHLAERIHHHFGVTILEDASPQQVSTALHAALLHGARTEAQPQAAEPDRGADVEADPGEAAAVVEAGDVAPEEANADDTAVPAGSGEDQPQPGESAESARGGLEAEQTPALAAAALAEEPSSTVSQAEPGEKPSVEQVESEVAAGDEAPAVAATETTVHDTAANPAGDGLGQGGQSHGEGTRAGRGSRRRPRTDRGAGAQQMAFLWGPAEEDGGGDGDEPVRGDGAAPLAAVAAPPVQPDPGPGELLRGAGGGSGGEDRGSDVAAGGAGSGGRELPGQGRPAEHGAAAGGGDRAPGAGVVGAGAGSRPGPAGSGGPGGVGAGPARPAGGSGRGVDVDGDRARPPAVRGSAPAAPGAEPAQLTAPARFRPTSQDDLAPSGAVARVRANLEALSTLRLLQREQRAATAEEQARLARWSGWGAVPEVFDERREDFAWARAELAQLLSQQEYQAAARNTLNAHYTDAAIVQAVWEGVAQLGFAGGRVLEPGCGSGNFIGFAPEGAEIVGVELEPVTAAIAAALYPDARILNESFADTRAREGSFDLVIGNVPFGRFALADRRHNPNGHSIHNHFIIKGLHLTRPGGLLAVLTSRYTMDATNPAARREIAGLADLVGAVRLPSSAHQRAAGTSVVTDLLIFRRREADRAPGGADWERTRPVDVEAAQVRINQYFVDHPEHVLGDLAVGGAHHAENLVVNLTGELQPALRAALARIADQARQHGLVMSEAVEAEQAARPAALVAATDRPDGYLQANPDGTFSRVVDGQVEPYTPPRSQAGELRDLLGLRDTAVALLEAEAASLDDTDEIGDLRAELNRRYDAYVAQYGPINRFTLRRTGRVNQDTGEETTARVRPPQGGFREDPFAPLVYALENFDPEDQRATKAEIFRQRAVAPRVPRLGADTPEDALAICLDTHGEVRLSEIARLLGCDENEARARLANLVFDDPVEQRLVPAAEYLSGDVREKLAIAREAAKDDPRYEVNVRALTEVIPPDLQPEDIDARLGAAWIDASYVEQFLQETLDDPTLRVEHPGGSVWGVSGRCDGVLATSTWGTDRFPAPKLAQAILEQRRILVTDNIGTRDNPKYVVNLDATAAAQEKAEELKERFAEWVWEDPERAEDLVRVYNDKFNNIVLRSYDNAQLSLPGLALNFKPRPHQVAAVARIINEPAVLLAHEVGAGKTAEMTMGCMELRRLGLARKPAIVVPNHMLEQFQREFLQLYPQAKVLVATKEDLRADRRRAFVARCATGDWDAVIISHSSFEKIPMSKEAQESYLSRETARYTEFIQQARELGGQSSLTVKRLEAAKLRAEERIKRKLSSLKDPGITFEATGIDYLFVDEAHLFKNLRTPSAIPDAAIDGSNRATDLDMKIHYLRERNGRRVVTFATATPIANSVTEAYVMQKYLRPDLLEKTGVSDFDSWAATFGEVRVEIEFSPDGNGFRQKGRFAKFTNVPEMLRMWHVSADIKTADDLNLPTPQLKARADGQRAPETVVVEPSEELLEFVAELGERAEKVRSRQVAPWEDNMLKISSEGRAAALDLRLIGRDIDPAVPTKLEVAADRIAAIWEENKDRVYLDREGQPHPIPGALQLVFCDLGTPREGWNVYDELRDLLVARGMPREQIRFIHEAGNDREKAELFAACRSGRVAVLIGSTEKMGVGTNVQDRAVALHHLDCPWRPADLQQRDGRILRQGNQNPEVQIIRYVTERSFDGYTWQGVERKARFIGQVMKGRLDVREMEDIGEQALSFQEVKALATGNPLLLELAEAEAAVTRLERKQRAHLRNQDMLRRTITVCEQNIAGCLAKIDQIDAAIARRKDTRGDAFAMTLEGIRHTKRADAGRHLKNIIGQQLTVVDKGTHDRQHAVAGELGGFPVTTTVERVLGSIQIRVTLEGAPEAEVPLWRENFQSTDPVGLVGRLENRLARLEQVKNDTLAEIERMRTEAERARASIGAPFAQAEELAAARERLDALKLQLEKLADTRPVFDPDQVREALADLAGACNFTAENDQEVIFDLDGGRRAAVAAGRDPERPYRVWVFGAGECAASREELAEVVRYLAGDTDGLSPEVRESLRARFHDNLTGQEWGPSGGQQSDAAIHDAQPAPIGASPADDPAVDAARVAALGFAWGPSQRLASAGNGVGVPTPPPASRAAQQELER